MPLTVDIITPEKLTVSDEVDFIAAPAADGEIGILPGHAPLLTRLGSGDLRLKKGGVVRHLAISGGFLEVQQGSRVAVFAETAEMADEIDAERAKQDLERAQSAIKDAKNLKDVDLAAAEALLSRALLRLKVSQLTQRRSAPKPDVH